MEGKEKGKGLEWGKIGMTLGIVIVGALIADVAAELLYRDFLKGKKKEMAKLPAAPPATT